MAGPKKPENFLQMLKQVTRGLGNKMTKSDKIAIENIWPDIRQSWWDAKYRDRFPEDPDGRARGPLGYTGDADSKYIEGAYSKGPLAVGIRGAMGCRNAAPTDPRVLTDDQVRAYAEMKFLKEALDDRAWGESNFKWDNENGRESDQHIFDKQDSLSWGKFFPTMEQIQLDPQSYTEYRYPYGAYAKKLITGED